MVLVWRYTEIEETIENVHRSVASIVRLIGGSSNSSEKAVEAAGN